MKVSSLKPQPSNQESFFDILTHKTVSKDFIFEAKLSRLINVISITAESMSISLAGSVLFALGAAVRR